MLEKLYRRTHKIIYTLGEDRLYGIKGISNSIANALRSKGKIR